MTIQNLLNLIGLIINMTGALIMFYNAPKVQSQTFLYTDKELQEIEKNDKRKNQLSRYGMLILFIGFIVQSVALFL